MALSMMWYFILRNPEERSTFFNNIDKIQLKKKVVYALVKEEDVVLHCYLPEHFVSIKSKITKWAERKVINAEVAWRFYINIGAYRLMMCLRYARDGFVYADKYIPPLGVPLVWHAFLQDPSGWNNVASAIGFDFARWNPDALLTALENNEPGLQFCPSTDCVDKIDLIYLVADSLDILYMAYKGVFSPGGHGSASSEWKRCFYDKLLTHTIDAIRGQCTLTYDFHASVQRQIELAEWLLGFSWHRMYVSLEDNEQAFRPAIKRYRRFMTLRRFQPQILGSRLGASNRLESTYLDINLIWRTHLLTPREYRAFCNSTFGRVISSLPCPAGRHRANSTLLDPTSQIYEHVFGEKYALCLCRPCVGSRIGESSGSFRLSRSTASIQPLEEEMDRRSSADVSIPLCYAEKQCRRCGSHPWRHCHKKDITQTLVVRPPTPELSVLSSIWPGIMSLDTPQTESTSATASASGAVVSNDHEPWWAVEIWIREPTRNRTPAPALTTGSTFSNDNDRESDPSKFTPAGSSRVVKHASDTSN